MKSILRKTLVVGLLSLVTVTSAQALWQCRMHNGRGEPFVASGVSRKAAAANVMMACAGRGTSSYARSCSLDYCGPVGPVGPVAGPWHCNIVNGRNIVMTGYGVSRKAAAANAMAKCAGRGISAYASTCRITYCG